jgi:hypothetical protein
MPARKKADEDAVDGILLAYDDFSNLTANLVEPGDGSMKGGIRMHSIIVASGSLLQASVKKDSRYSEVQVA